jgi:flagella basal body P-ring formation protein FlgA
MAQPLRCQAIYYKKSAKHYLDQCTNAHRDNNIYCGYHTNFTHPSEGFTKCYNCGTVDVPEDINGMCDLCKEKNKIKQHKKRNVKKNKDQLLKDDPEEYKRLYETEKKQVAGSKEKCNSIVISTQQKCKNNATSTCGRFCGKHFKQESLKESVEPVRYCSKARRNKLSSKFSIDPNTGDYYNICNDCRESNKKTLLKVKSNNEPCHAKSNTGNRCSNQSKPNSKYCIPHTDCEVDFDDNDPNIKQCKGCRNFFKNKQELYKLCTTCLKRSQQNNEHKLDIIRPKCQSIIDKGTDTEHQCTNNALDEKQFCDKHSKDQLIYDNPDKKYCKKQGCKNESPKFSQCDYHRNQDKLSDDKRRGVRSEEKEEIKKGLENDQDICSDCTIIFTKFKTKHNEYSTKCHTCYNKQSEVEANRDQRDRKEYYRRYEQTPARKISKRQWTKDNHDKSLKYCKKSRAKRRAEDPEGYLKRNAESHIEWVKNNPEKVKKIQAKNKHSKQSRFTIYKYSAKKRNIEFNLSEEKAYELFCDNCFYCDKMEDYKTMGIDRINNDIGYQNDNVVPCCKMCNMMKKQLSVINFIELCRCIIYYQDEEECSNMVNYVNRNYVSSNYRKYKNSANVRNKDFQLSESEFYTIVNDDCYMCGKPNSDKHLNGIDRVDNNIGYIKDNCKSTCGQCNYLKRDYELNKVLEKCALISNNHDLDDYVCDITNNIIDSDDIEYDSDNEECKEEDINDLQDSKEEESKFGENGIDERDYDDHPDDNNKICKGNSHKSVLEEYKCTKKHRNGSIYCWIHRNYIPVIPGYKKCSRCLTRIIKIETIGYCNECTIKNDVKKKQNNTGEFKATEAKRKRDTYVSKKKIKTPEEIEQQNIERKRRDADRKREERNKIKPQLTPMELQIISDQKTKTKRENDREQKHDTYFSKKKIKTPEEIEQQNIERNKIKPQLTPIELQIISDKRAEVIRENDRERKRNAYVSKKKIKTPEEIEQQNIERKRKDADRKREERNKIKPQLTPIELQIIADKRAEVKRKNDRERMRKKRADKN